VLRTFARGAVALVSLPSADACEHAFSLDFDTDELHDLIAMTRAETVGGVTVQVGETVLVVDDEPASLMMVDHDTLHSAFPVAAAFVYDPQPTVLDMLQHEVSSADWQKGGGGMPAPHRVGLLIGGVLVALASVADPIGHLARIRVLVAPTHRSRGLGRIVMQVLARHVLDQGLLPFCRLAMNDLAARAMIGAVGFGQLARTLTLRVSTIGSEGAVYGGPELRLG
jgi:GNAT superfamily N-acetyltransferase